MTGAVARPASASRGPVRAGVVAVPVAAALTALGAGLAGALGVDLAVAGEPIPVAGVAFVTAVLSVLGVGLAVALRRWSARPAEPFVRTTVALTAVSLVPPVLADADPSARITLVVLHLLAAGVVVPAVARSLRDG